MAEIKGLGKCALCYDDLSDPNTGVSSPIRHWKGYQMAHKTCFDKQKAHELTKEYQVEQALKEVQSAEHKVNAAQYQLDVARVKLARVMEDVQQD